MTVQRCWTRIHWEHGNLVRLIEMFSNAASRNEQSGAHDASAESASAER